MKIGKLIFEEIENQLQLLGKTVSDKILTLSEKDKKSCLVAKINKEFMGGRELCDKYEINPEIGVNCLIVKGKSNGEVKYCALLVQVGNKYDINGILKSEVGCRMSVAPLEEVLGKTGMEYGSITPVGLPKDWLIFADSKIFEQERIICGSGKQMSKLSIPTNILEDCCNVKRLHGLAIKND